MPSADCFVILDLLTESLGISITALSVRLLAYGESACNRGML